MKAGIDVGDYFDMACQALALKLKIPYVMGGTFQHTMTVDFIGDHGKPCLACLSDVSNKEVKAKLNVKDIDTYSDLGFLPHDDHPTGASNIYVAATASNMMVSQWVQWLNGNKIPSRLIFYYSSYEVDKWDVQPEPHCHLCGSPEEPKPTPPTEPSTTTTTTTS